MDVTEPTAWSNVAFRSQNACANGQAQAATAMTHSPDVVIAAFGTNDIGVTTTAETVACYQAIAAAIKPRPLWVALTPPTLPPAHDTTAEVDELNTALLAAFPGRTIDFHSGFTSEMYLDGIHLGPTGQELRARRAVAALTGSR